MSKIEYFLECIGESLSQMGIYESLTRDQMLQLAKDVENGVDCMSMMFPTPSARDFENSEIKQLKKRIAELENKLSDADMDFRKNVAMRRNCDVNDVTLLGNGKAEFHY